MPILVALLALLLPRLTMIFLWLFTDWFHGVFRSMLWPILGFIFLPLTTLWYSAVVHWFGGRWDAITVAGIVVALIIDLSPTRYRRRRRVVVVEE